MSFRGSPIKRLEPFRRVEEEYNLEVNSLISENEKLNKLIFSKNQEIQSLNEEINFMKEANQTEIFKFKSIIKDLEVKTNDYETLRLMEIQAIKIRHEKNSQESEELNNYHQHQIQFLLKQIAQLRSVNDLKDQRVQLKDHEMRTLKESFERQASQLINEINGLRSNLLRLQEEKNKQIKDISNKRELEKSRNTGIVTSRNQNTLFIEKQLRKLNEQILQKSIKIQNFSRELNKQKKKHEEIQKSLNKKIQSLTTEKQEEINQKNQYFAKVEKSLKQEILDFKEKQMQYLNKIDSLQNQLQRFKSQENTTKSLVQQKNNEIKQIRVLIQQQRQQHVRQINNLINRKRSSKSKLGSSRSLTSSLKDSNIISTSNQQIQQVMTGKIVQKLPQVKQESPDRKDISKELNNSDLYEQMEEDNQLARTIVHYELIIQQLKKTHHSQQELLRHKLNKIQKNLVQKQQEMLDMLIRFSPLVKIHAQQKTLQEDRKQRINQHWKSDLALLQILLKKNKIEVFD